MGVRKTAPAILAGDLSDRGADKEVGSPSGYARAAEGRQVEGVRFSVRPISRRIAS